MDTPRIQYAKTEDGVSIAFATAGSGLPLLLLDGFIQAGLDYRLSERVEYAEGFRMAAAERLVVAFDWRGSGLSGRAANFGPREFVMDVEAVLAQAKIDEFDVFANTTPCHVAIELALRYPNRVRRMVFASPSARGSTFHTSHRTAPINHLADTHWELYAELISLIRWGWQDIDYARRFRDRLLTGWTNETWKKLWEAVDQLEAFDHAGMVTCPCLVILGSLESDPDRAQVARRLAADLPQGRLETNRGFSFDSLGTFKMALAFLSAADLSKAPKRFAASPAAFRTILFTDLEAHTAMMHRLGDAKGREVLREHERLSREALRAHGGTEVKTIGDSFMASFPSAQKAVECAIALQRAFEASECAGERLRIRVGINAGEPIADEDDLFGASVILASRTKEKAAGGQILVTNVVRELVAGKGFLFSDTGEFEMKGFEEPVRLYEVRWQEAAG